MKKFIASIAFALAGIKQCFLKERNFMIQIIMGVITIVFSFIYNLSQLEWAVVIICISLVLAAEMINTSIEKICNHISPNFHPAIKSIKDIAAGAVLLIAIASLIIGSIIFIPKIF